MAQLAIQGQQALQVKQAILDLLEMHPIQVPLEIQVTPALLERRVIREIQVK
jgi:hypothetical protein